VCSPCTKNNARLALLITQDRLDALAKAHSNFKIHYIVDKADSKSWKGR